VATRNLLSPVLAAYMLQLLRSKADTLVASVTMELASHLRASESRALWTHFSRHYNPVARVMAALGAFVPPPTAANVPLTSSSSEFGGGFRASPYGGGLGGEGFGYSRGAPGWGDSPYGGGGGPYRRRDDEYTPHWRSSDEPPRRGPISAPRGGGAQLMESKGSASYAADFDFD
jgi:hypothetical protein